jgi:hypothetical protein
VRSPAGARVDVLERHVGEAQSIRVRRTFRDRDGPDVDPLVLLDVTKQKRDRSRRAGMRERSRLSQEFGSYDVDVK